MPQEGQGLDNGRPLVHERENVELIPQDRGVRHNAHLGTVAGGHSLGAQREDVAGGRPGKGDGGVHLLPGEVFPHPLAQPVIHQGEGQPGEVPDRGPLERAQLDAPDLVRGVVLPQQALRDTDCLLYTSRCV